VIFFFFSAFGIGFTLSSTNFDFERVRRIGGGVVALGPGAFAFLAFFELLFLGDGFFATLSFFSSFSFSFSFSSSFVSLSSNSE